MVSSFSYREYFRPPYQLHQLGVEKKIYQGTFTVYNAKGRSTVVMTLIFIMHPLPFLMDQVSFFLLLKEPSII